MFQLKKHILITLLIITSFSLSSFSQLIENKEAKIAIDDYFFLNKELQKRKVKTISVSFSKKYPLQPIEKNHFKTHHFSINKSGELTRIYKTKKLTQNVIDTTVEWRYYKDGQIATIKNTGVGRIKVKSIFYENNYPSTYIYGYSTNSNKSKIDLSVSSYKEEKAEYIDYIPLKKKDTLIKYKSITSVIYKKVLKEWIDSNSLKITCEYPLSPKKNYAYQYSYEFKKCTSLIVQKANSPTFRYDFQYSTEGKMLSFSKFDTKQNTSIEFSELIYNEKSGMLRAIITKDVFDKTIFIKKYSYTYYE